MTIPNDYKSNDYKKFWQHIEKVDELTSKDDWLNMIYSWLTKEELWEMLDANEYTPRFDYDYDDDEELQDD